MLLLAAVILAAAYLAYRRAFFSPDKVQNDVYNIPRDEQYEPYRAKMVALIDRLVGETDFEEVSIRSRDGLRLYGRYYHLRDGAPLAIGVHGYRGTAERDMCGGFQLARAAGQNVLLIDQRAHARSEGHTITFGIREKFDVCDWVSWARERFGEETKILLYGVSMGAATVLLSAPLLEGKICGIVADSPYSSPREIIEKVSRDEGLPPHLAWPVIVLGARIFGGFSPLGADVAEAVRESSVPVLIIHGEEDRFVPQEMSARLTVREGVERCSFPDAGHGISAILHTEKYNELVQRFLERCAE
ncbi:MAG: alpha/beta hydrolase [Oscillospiraceae bacterium]|nr:alpha/beta hydrolase [Oscillospiraceae bacterium]